MNRHRPGRSLPRLAVAGTTALLTLAALGAPVAAAGAQDAAGPAVDAVPVASASGVRAPEALDLSWLTDADAPVSAFVRVRATGAASTYVRTEGSAARSGAARPERVAETAAVRQAAAAAAVNGTVESAMERVDAEAETLYETTYTVPGIAVRATPDVLRELAGRGDVVAIDPLVARTADDDPADDTTGAEPAARPANGNSDVLTRARAAWQQTGRTGRGVNVAVIDTGVDYTHAAFGGDGRVETYQQALASTKAPNRAWYDPAKYLGGWDFAGTEYNAASGPSYFPQPVPDANPLDGPGGRHGTHVAGTAVGYGVQGGQRFAGDYTALTDADVAAMDIGPGSAPESGMYVLKVFGDFGGSTELTGAALDWVARQVVSGTRIDVVNLSLGTDYGAPDDPDGLKLAALMDLGVLPVVAAGNSGDVTDVGGAPGNAGRVLTVAASSSGAGLLDGVRVEAPADLAGVVAGQYSQELFGSPDVAADVVVPTGENLDGCSPFSAEQQERIAGRIVWLAWDENDLTCGSKVRFDNAQAAGAAGVVLTSTREVFENGIAGNENLPGVQLTAPASAALAGSAAAGTLRLHLDGSLAGTIRTSSEADRDTLASFSSRGLHGSFDDVVKPDVAAPGVNVISAGSGTGSGRAVLSGTSMASPHAAGIAALIKQAHPGWTPDQVKAGLMNTAVHDVRDGRSGRVMGQLRSGTGRADALAGVRNQVLVTSEENPGLVTGSFGVVEVGAAPVTTTRTFLLSNLGATDVSYAAAYRTRVPMPGATIDVDRSSIVVPAGGVARITATLRVDPAALRRSIDPTSSRVQGGVDRVFVPSTDGVLELTPTGSSASSTPPLRVSVFAAPRPTSQMTAGPLAFSGDRAALPLGGRSLDQGTGSERYRSLAAPFQLGALDPADVVDGPAPATLDSMDLRAVGAASTAPQLADPSRGILAFAVATERPWPMVSPFTNPVVNIDVDLDGTVDFATFATAAGDEVDQPLAVTVDLATNEPVDVQPIDSVGGSTDTSTTDTNVMVLPVSLAKLGYTRTTTATTLRYQVYTQSPYAPVPEDDFAGVRRIDEAPSATFDVFAPDLWFGEPGTGDAGAVLFADTPGTLPVHRASGSSASLLLLHLHNATEQRYQVLAPQHGAATDGGARDGEGTRTGPGTAGTPVSVAPPAVTGQARVGSTLTATTGTWDRATTTAAYQWRRDGVAVPGATSATYRPTAADRSHVLSVVVTVDGGASAVSAPTAPVAAGRLAAVHRPAVKGASRVGSVLRARIGAWSAPASVRVTWKVGSRTVGHARRLILTRAMAGERVRMVLVVSAEGYATERVVRRAGTVRRR